MRFCDLPVEMNVGGAYLTPVNEDATLKAFTCFSCDRMSLSVFLCSEQHVLCKMCCIPELWPSKKVWCPVCRLAVTAHEARFSTRVLDELQFECACGFRGTLVAMRVHLLQEPTSTESQRVCGGEVGRAQSLASASEAREDLDDRIRNIAIEEMGKMKPAMLDEVTQRFNNDHFSERLVQQRNELIENIEAQKTDLLSMIQRLEEKVSAHDETLRQGEEYITSGISINASASTAYLWFNFEDLLRRFRTTRKEEQSPSQSTIVAGIHLEVFILLQNINNKDYLGIYLKLIKGSRQDTPVPLNRTFISSIYDVNGKAIAGKMFNSLEDGEYYAACGTSPSGFSSYQGHSDIMTVSSVREKCLVGEMICVSVGVSSMQSGNKTRQAF